MLVDLGTADDAGVYQITEDLALISTVDFFTPIVDDPFDFGRIAVANAFELKSRLIEAGIKNTTIVGKVFNNESEIINII